MHGSNSLPVPQLKSSASSIADLAVLGIRLGRLYQSAPFRHWSTASAPVGGAINLSRRLRFRGRGFRLCAFCFVALYLRLLALRHRLLHFDFLASIVVANFVSRAAGDLHATVAINLEAVIADQRANASTLRLTASSASTLATLTSSFMPACLLNRSSARCDAVFQLPSTEPVLQPTRRNSA